MIDRYTGEKVCRIERIINTLASWSGAAVPVPPTLHTVYLLDTGAQGMKAAWRKNASNRIKFEEPVL